MATAPGRPLYKEANRSTGDYSPPISSPSLRSTPLRARTHRDLGPPSSRPAPTPTAVEMAAQAAWKKTSLKHGSLLSYISKRTIPEKNTQHRWRIPTSEAEPRPRDGEF